MELSLDTDQYYRCDFFINEFLRANLLRACPSSLAFKAVKCMYFRKRNCDPLFISIGSDLKTGTLNVNIICFAKFYFMIFILMVTQVQTSE